MGKLKSRPYEGGLHERLRSDFQHAVNYVRAAAEDSMDGFLLALRDVAEARVGMSDLASGAELNRENLYRMLSEVGNPRLESLWSVLEVMGLRITVEQIGSSAPTGTDEKEIIGTLGHALSEKNLIGSGTNGPQSRQTPFGGSTYRGNVAAVQTMRKGPSLALWSAGAGGYSTEEVAVGRR